MKKFFITLLTFIFIINNINVNVYAKNLIPNNTPIIPANSDKLDLHSESVILMDAKTGAILYKKNPTKQMYPASITKILSAIITLENASLNETITYSHNAVYSLEYNSANIGILVGEKLSLEDSLNALLISSANEVAYGIAEHIAGSLDEFTNMMNEKAYSLGCVNSNFTNANGLHSDDHYTCAYDMALITKEALKHQIFRNISSTTSYKIKKTKLYKENRYLHMKHQMLYPNNKYYYEGIEGGKTGYTSKAFTTLVSYAKRGNLELICVVLKAHGVQVYEDTIKLFDYGFNNYSEKTLVTTNILNNNSSFLADCIYNRFYPMIDLNIPKKISYCIPNIYSENLNNVNFKISNLDNNKATLSIYYNNNLLNSTNINYKINNTTNKEIDNPTNIIEQTLESMTSQEKNIIISSLGILALIIITIIILLVIIKKKRELNEANS